MSTPTIPSSNTSSWWPFSTTKSSTTQTNINNNNNTTTTSSCPVSHEQKSAISKDGSHLHKASLGAAICPVSTHDEKDKINSLNMMPTLSQEMSPGQKTRLSTERSLSTIPKGQEKEEENTWVYPSPQQFYNALNRKGWETSEGDVPTMVAIHNFLNEACWQEILKWEKLHECDCKTPKLARFMGKPSTLSPKARIMNWAGVEKPFDRHDWIIDRCGREVRYVIDYYSGYDQPDAPVFHVDVRPALDSPLAFVDRTRVAFQRLYDYCFNDTRTPS